MTGISAGTTTWRAVVLAVLMAAILTVSWQEQKPRVAHAQAGEWQHESQTGGVTGAIAADNTGLFVTSGTDLHEPGESPRYEFALDHYTPGGTVTRRWTSDVQTGWDVLRVAASGGTAYTSVFKEYDATDSPVGTIRQHPANGSPGWTQVHPRPDELLADETGVYLHAVRKDGGAFHGIIRKLDPVTGAEIWTRDADFPPFTGVYAGRRTIAIGDGGLYVYGGRLVNGESHYRIRRYDLTNGAETWPTPIELGDTSVGHAIAATSGGLYVQTVYFVAPGPLTTYYGARVSRYDLTPSLTWTKDIAIDDEDVRYFAGITAEPSSFSLLFYPRDPGGSVVGTIHTYDPAGTEVGAREFPLTPFPAGSNQGILNYTARDGGTYVLGLYQYYENGTSESRAVVARLLPQINLKGKVTWSDAYPDKVGQGVQGATVTVGSQTFTTDSNGEYEVTSDLVGQTAFITFPIFDHSGASASVGPDGDLMFSKAAAAAGGSDISLTINEQIKLDIDPNTGKIKPTATFGKNVQFKGFGQTFNLTNLKLTDQGVQNVGGTAQLAFKYDANSPPMAINVNLTYVKASNTLTINGVSGSQFQWGGQTATLTKFALVSSPTVNSVSIEGTVNLTLSGVAIAATLKGDGTAQGVVITAVGNAVSQGITVEFNPITVENGQFRVKGRVKLPNQSAYLAFNTTTGFSAPRLVLPLPQFQWDGQALPLQLELQGSAINLAGEGNVQIGGQAVAVKVGVEQAVISSATTTVRVHAAIPMPDSGTAEATLEFDPAKPQNLAVRGTMAVKLALCPGKTTDFNVSVTASSSNIKLGFKTSVLVDCDGNGTSTLVDVKGDFDGQLAQLKVSWPITVGNFNGKVAATAKSDGTFFELMFNVELKFGPGARASASSADGASQRVGVAAASDVRVLLTDGVGRRTGFDPATGQILNEIPGGRWDGLVNGMDTFTMPGRVGGYTVSLFSTASTQANVTMTVAGQAQTFSASVGPGAPTTLAAETVPQGSGVQSQITPVAVGCAPRPRVQIAPAPGGGALRATFTAQPGSSIATNTIREIRIGQKVLNGVVDAEGRTNLRAGAVITFPSPVTTATLTIRRESAGQATTVPLIIVDGCGEWNTFVGGGPSAF